LALAQRGQEFQERSYTEAQSAESEERQRRYRREDTTESRETEARNLEKSLTVARELEEDAKGLPGEQRAQQFQLAREIRAKALGKLIEQEIPVPDQSKKIIGVAKREEALQNQNDFAQLLSMADVNPTIRTATDRFVKEYTVNFDIPDPDRLRSAAAGIRSALESMGFEPSVIAMYVDHLQIKNKPGFWKKLGREAAAVDAHWLVKTIRPGAFRRRHRPPIVGGGGGGGVGGGGGGGGF
jgi:hypothetical protein